MKTKRERGFTLIELLIVIAIIGILAAIAVPNFLNAFQRARQKRTMADMHALATAVESYHVDNNTFPPAACGSGIYTDLGLTLDSASFANISPTYVASVPLRDGWGSYFVYDVDNARSIYNIRSLGRNQSADGIACGTTTDFNDDILFTNGTFAQWPEGSQQ